MKNIQILPLLVHPLFSILGWYFAFFVDGFGFGSMLLGFVLAGILRSSTRRKQFSPVGALPGFVVVLLPGTVVIVAYMAAIVGLLPDHFGDFWVSGLLAGIAFLIYAFGVGSRRFAWWCGWLVSILSAIIVQWKFVPHLDATLELETATMYISILTAEIVEALTYGMDIFVQRRVGNSKTA